MVRKIVFCVVGLLLSAIRAEIPDEEWSYSNLRYGTHDRQKLDVWMPMKNGDLVPVVMYVHGGGWTKGKKRDKTAASLLGKCRRANCALVSVEYRFLGDAERDGIHPPVRAPMSDVAAAVEFVLNNAKCWNVDVRRIGITGGSAGACSSLSVALSDSNRYGIRAVAAFWPQTSLDPKEMVEWIPNISYGGSAFGYPDFKTWLVNRASSMPWIVRFSPIGLLRKCPPARVPSILVDTPAVLKPGEFPKDPTHAGEFRIRFGDACKIKGCVFETLSPGKMHDRLIELLKEPLSETLDYAGVKAVVNYDEMEVRSYSLEDPLVFADGRKVRNAVDWSHRRREILDLFSKEMYGKEPPLPETIDIKVVDEKVSCAGYAIRKRFRMGFRKDGSGPKIDWILYRPRHIKGPVPVLVFLNYRGNHELTNEADVKPTSGWCQSSARTDGHRASERTRGIMTDPASDTYLPMNSILARGYAVMSACYCDVSPDPINPAWGEKEFPQDKFSYTGVFGLWPKRNPDGESEITSMGAWAWALSRAVDYVNTDSSLDLNRIVATGCSRLAKAALLAAARDERIAVCAPVQTGGGGCPLAKRNYGETIQVQMLSFSHWFCKAYGKYAKAPWATLPFDQHLLLSSIAPRALLVLGFDNRWYDPKGEYLAVKAASPVWEFLGVGKFPDRPFPDVFDLSCVGENVGYAMRSEKHGISAWDWKVMLDFADASFSIESKRR